MGDICWPTATLDRYLSAQYIKAHYHLLAYLCNIQRTDHKFATEPSVHCGVEGAKIYFLCQLRWRNKWRQNFFFETKTQFNALFHSFLVDLWTLSVNYLQPNLKIAVDSPRLELVAVGWSLHVYPLRTVATSCNTLHILLRLIVYTGKSALLAGIVTLHIHTWICDPDSIASGCWNRRI